MCRRFDAKRFFETSLIVLVYCGAASAADLDLTRAAVLTPPGLTGPEAKAVQMLVEEVEKRSWVDWRRTDTWPTDGTPVLLVGPGAGVATLANRGGVSVPFGDGLL